MNRDCNKCIHHISGKCDAWECDMKTLEDYRDKIIDRFVSRLAWMDLDDELGIGDILDELMEEIKEIAEKLKKDGVEI